MLGKPFTTELSSIPGLLKASSWALTKLPRLAVVGLCLQEPKSLFQESLLSDSQEAGIPHLCCYPHSCTFVSGLFAFYFFFFIKCSGYGFEAYAKRVLHLWAAPQRWCATVEVN